MELTNFLTLKEQVALSTRRVQSTGQTSEGKEMEYFYRNRYSTIFPKTEKKKKKEVYSKHRFQKKVF